MLDINGAVEAEWPDEGVAAHYGDPAREQRGLTEGQVLVDRTNRGVVKVTGPDRLSWLHSLTSQHLERITPGRTEEALILSPQGHIEHHLSLTDDGAATWIHVEPHTAKALVDYLDSMRFMLRVTVEDRSAELGVLTLAGPLPAGGGVISRTGAGAARPVLPGGDGGVAAVLDGPFGTDLIAAPDVAARLTAAYPVAGLWAFEAARIAAGIPRPGLDTDHKTLPHEVGLIETAVHLNKGCYRGQETVARIHNLGHPPRRLVFLHLDGSVDRLPAHGAPLTLADGTQVGFVGSAARHFELGPIGLGLVKRSVDPGATLLADGIAAAQEVIVAPDAGGNVKVTLRRDSVPQPPSGRRMLLSGSRQGDYGATATLSGDSGSGGLMLRKALLAAAASERIRQAAMSAPGAQAIVGRYVAGESSEGAVEVARALRSAGLLVTLDYLGEDTTDAQRAAATAAQYVHLLGKLAAEGLTEGGAVEVSVKPTAIGLLLGTNEGTSADRAPDTMAGPAIGRAAGGSSPREIGVRIATEHLERIVSAARDAGTTVTVDAEDHRTTQAGLRVAAALRPRFGSLGSVLQAALRRTEADARELAAPGVRVRLCKGAYAEPASEAYEVRHDIDKSFARCLRILMAGPGYPMIATHDPRLIAITRSLGMARPAGSFEYQMLYGVRPDEQRRLAASGAKVRVYVPYGGDWYPYLVRRLAERPANLALFLRSLGSSS